MFVLIQTYIIKMYYSYQKNYYFVSIKMWVMHGQDERGGKLYDFNCSSLCVILESVAICNPLASRASILCLLLSVGGLRHNALTLAATCSITLLSNRLSWVFAHPAEPFFLSSEDGRMILCFIGEINALFRVDAMG